MLSHWSLEWMPALHGAGAIWRPHSSWRLLFAGFLWSPTWTSLCHQSTQIRSLVRKSPPPKKKRLMRMCVQLSFSCLIPSHISGRYMLPVMYCMSAQQRLPICIFRIYNLRSECHHYYFLYCSVSRAIAELTRWPPLLKRTKLALAYKPSTMEAVYLTKPKRKEKKSQSRG